MHQPRRSADLSCFQVEEDHRTISGLRNELDAVRASNSKLKGAVDDSQMLKGWDRVLCHSSVPPFRFLFPVYRARFCFTMYLRYCA